jgi:inorganic pyrophosphatase
MELENNVFFWQKMDTIALSSKIQIVRPKDTSHPDFANLVYPVDYGCFMDMSTTESDAIHVYRGTKKPAMVQAVAVSVDILKRDMDVKVLYGCTEDEELEILRFLNQTDYQKCFLVHRGKSIPNWALSEN